MKPLWSKLGTAIGIPMGGIEMWISSLLGGFSFFGTMKHGKTDAASLKPAKNFKPIDYPKPDGVISFDKLTNVSFTNTYHEEDQPVHLKVADLAVGPRLRSAERRLIGDERECHAAHEVRLHHATVDQ